ncbi:O-glucosyltransferase rumi isoform X1 [Ananas comosus]|uniref:O-glucosyltransferase rumi isoform X1 n=1 Tax=Ananas comosus TaxID=4615 RepID=A0A6P5H0W0_ANACO|nr:O-glucosyltransferase rumi isoform X1 [Ananas comosus]
MASSSPSPTRSSAAAAGGGVERRLILPLLLAAAALLLLSLQTLTSSLSSLSSRTPTLTGHNLAPTPWHPFPRPNPNPNPNPNLSLLRCAYLSCPLSSAVARRKIPSSSAPDPARPRPACPGFFRAIRRDLAPWRRARISAALLEDARRRAAMRVVVAGGGRRLFVDLYYACVQSRALFTVWGILQLMRRYPGILPDADLMFDCMDRPAINRSDYRSDVGGGIDDPNAPIPPPLFRYCTTKDHFDIPFPDWSFWGWPEINIKPWNEEFRSIKLGAQAVKWKKRAKTSYWKGNPNVESPVRTALLSCNDSKTWGARIMRQDWGEESSSGFQKSKLSSQCNHRYKIYAEGYAWSVSLKYILSCGSLAFVVDPQYEDFFSRGLVPKENYWPVSSADLCRSIKSAVDWGNAHPSQAEAIGKRGQKLMQDLDMDRVYDYMYHLIVEYSKLLDFKPTPPPSAQEVCVDSLLCVADEQQRQFLERSAASPSPTYPCTLPPPSFDSERRLSKRLQKVRSGIREERTRQPESAA